MKSRLVVLILITIIIFTGCVQEEQLADVQNEVESGQTYTNENIEESADVETDSISTVKLNEDNSAGWVWWDDFDRRLCGKWKSEEMIYGSITFLNIEFDENKKEKGVKVNIGFGEENTPDSVFYVEYSYDSLYFFHNDRQFRMEYTLAVDGNDADKADCILIQRSNSIEQHIKFTRISAPLSEEELKEYTNSKYVVAPKIISKIDILREYAEYGSERYDAKFEYRFDEREKMLDIIEKYNLDELVEGKSDVDTAIALMNWVCERYKHGNPPGGLAEKRTPQALMEFADKNDSTTNCRGLSLILAQLIRAYNIEVFHITCMPYEEPFDDCHVVVSVYSESLNKWIMLDPTYNLYLMNENNEIIGIEEFRDILIADGQLTPNSDAAYHGVEDSFDLEFYRDYMAKNLIRLQRGTVFRYGSDNTDGWITLIPNKYMQNEAGNFGNTLQNFMTSREDFWGR